MRFHLEKKCLYPPEDLALLRFHLEKKRLFQPENLALLRFHRFPISPLTIFFSRSHSHSSPLCHKTHIFPLLFLFSLFSSHAHSHSSPYVTKPIFSLYYYYYYYPLTHTSILPPMSQNPAFPSIILLMIICLSLTLPFFPMCHKTHPSLYIFIISPTCLCRCVFSLSLTLPFFSHTSQAILTTPFSSCTHTPIELNTKNHQRISASFHICEMICSLHARLFYVLLSSSRAHSKRSGRSCSLPPNPVAVGRGSSPSRARSRRWRPR